MLEFGSETALELLANLENLYTSPNYNGSWRRLSIDTHLFLDQLFPFISGVRFYRWQFISRCYLCQMGRQLSGRYLENGE